MQARPGNHADAGARGARTPLVRARAGAMGGPARAAGLLVALCAVLAFPATAAAANFTANAALELGSTNFTSTNQGPSMGNGLDGPTGVSMHSGGGNDVVYIADQDSNRVVGGNVTAATGFTYTFGVGNTGTSDYRWACTQTQTRRPADVSGDTTNKYAIADKDNNRILLFNTSAKTAGSGQAASFVLGQGNFTGCGTGLTASTVDHPEGVWTNGTKIAVADTQNNRVLLWNAWPAANGAAAAIVLGQPDFVTAALDDGAESKSTLQAPQGVWSDGTRLIVADSGNNRVLIWNTWPVANQQAANVVVGQPDGVTVSAGCTSTKLNQPSGVSSNGTKLVISVRGSHRVLLYDTMPAADGAAANRVLGETALNSCSMNGGNLTVNASGMDGPEHPYTDGTTIAVPDSSFNRVMVWTAWPAANNTAAAKFWGQANGTDSTAQRATNLQNEFAVSPTAGVSSGEGIWPEINPLGGLLIGDAEENKLNWWNAAPTVNDQAPDHYFGQDDTVTQTCGNAHQDVDSSSLCGSSNVWTDGTKLLVADRHGDRVLVWDTYPAADNTPADHVLGQPDFTSQSSALGQSTLDNPQGVASDGTHIAVVDRNNNRVMIWNSWPTSNGANADFELGQPDFTTNTSNTGGRSAQSLNDPIDVSTWGGKLAVTDDNNQRILIWNSWPTANRQAADVEIGSPNMTTTGSLGHATGVELAGNAIFYSLDDEAQYIDPIPSSNVSGAAPGTTIGSTAGGETPSQGNLYRGSGIGAYGGTLWVGVDGNARAMRWDDTVNPIVTVAPAASVGCNGVTFTWTTSESGSTEVYWDSVSRGSLGAYANSYVDPVMRNPAHSVTLSIPPGTYYYRVQSKDWGGLTHGLVSEGTFTVPTPPASTNAFEDDTNAQAGTANNSALTSATPHFSFLNNSGCTVTKHRTRVYSDNPDLNLQGLWRLDGNTVDTGWGLNNMVLGAAAQAPTYDTGVSAPGTSTPFGQSLKFDGVDDKAWAPAAIPYNRTNDFTFDAWFKTGVTNIASFNDPFPRIVQKGATCSGAASCNFNLYIDRATNNICGASSVAGVMKYVCAPATGYVDGHWHFIAYTVSAANLATLYVDGVAVNSLALGGPTDAPAGQAMNLGWTGGTWQGWIDEPRYSKVARSAADIRGIFEARQPHARLLWDSDPTDSGTAISSCNTATRCADQVYGSSGTVNPLTGGRSLVQQEFAGAGAWSAWSAFDWFEQRTGRPVNLYTHDTNAQAPNIANRTAIAAATPHFSWLNTSGASADKQRVQVVTDRLDNVQGLWHFDTATGKTTDSSGNGRTLTPVGVPTSPSGPSGFAEALGLDGSTQSMSIPPAAAFDLSSNFTVDAWIKHAAAISTYDDIVLKSGGSCFASCNFTIALQQGTGTLNGRVTVGGTVYEVATPAASVTDNQWHHVAITVSNSATPTLTLYVDGSPAGSIALPGPVDTPSTAFGIGTSSTGPDWVGQIDDVRIMSQALTAGEVAGYYTTRLPHYTTMWDSDTSDTGVAQAACADLTRCADVVYGTGGTPAGGTPLVHNGARYYVREKTRQGAGVWSDWSEWDWFEVSTALTLNVTSGATTALGAALPNVDTTGTSTITVTTNQASGYQLTATNASDTNGMTSGGNNIAKWTGTPATPTLWGAGTAGGFGLTVLTASGGKDTALWGTGTLPTDFATNKYAGPMLTSAALLFQRPTYSAATDTTVVGYRLDPGPAQAPGAYSTTVTYTATANP